MTLCRGETLRRVSMTCCMSVYIGRQNGPKTCVIPWFYNLATQEYPLE